MNRRGRPKAGKAKVERPRGRKVPAGDGAEVRDLEKPLAEALKREAEAREQQTATAEILRVISRSPTDTRPVFDAVAENSARLCEALDVVILRREGKRLRLVAHHGSILVGPIGEFFLPLVRGTAPGRSVLEGRTVHVGDLLTEADEFPESSENARRMGFRATLCVPLLQEGAAIGVIALRRTEAILFTEQQVTLLETFAAQAVIAIENVRLFKELEARNHDLTEALEQQTATAEILSVIAGSPTDVQPVLDSVVRTAMRLCDAYDASMFRLDGDRLVLTAHDGPIPAPAGSALPPLVRGSVVGRSVLDRRAVRVADLQSEDDDFPNGAAFARAQGHRSILSVPLLSEGAAVGAIAVRRLEVEPFTDKQISLLQTFADQAAIAIENVRLFTELGTRNRELTDALARQTATGEVLHVISRSQTDIQPVFDTILRSSIRLCEGVHGVVVQYDGELMHLVAEQGFPVESLVELQRRFPRRLDAGLIGGRAIIERHVVHIPDLGSDPTAPADSVAIARAGGYRGLLAVPMMRGAEPIGSIVVSRGQAVFSDKQIELMKTFADQAVIAIENVRLFTELEASNREIAEKSRQIEVASQHKSEFLANMSHELRTPLNAIIGFSEVLAEGMFGEVNDKQAEYLRDILESGRHLLSLINDILDLSKIEAGRMELEPSDFDLPSAVDNALTLVRERAARRGITLGGTIDRQAGSISADERKVKQVLLNLLSNAIKFTPEGGRIEVRASVRDGLAEVSVTDTGVGIAPEDQESVFEEFRQVGSADKKVEGTGLGLALSRRFVELHGGRIWVESQVGRGSTFTFTLPVEPR